MSSAGVKMERMKHGYARVSTDDQNPALSGATTKRPALLRCLKRLEHSDTPIVWKIDRLDRSLRDLITMLDDLRTCGVKFHSLTEGNRHHHTHESRYVADDWRSG